MLTEKRPSNQLLAAFETWMIETKLFKLLRRMLVIPNQNNEGKGRGPLAVDVKPGDEICVLCHASTSCDAASRGNMVLHTPLKPTTSKSHRLRAYFPLI